MVSDSPGTFLCSLSLITGPPWCWVEPCTDCLTTSSAPFCPLSAQQQELCFGKDPLVMVS